MLKTKRKNGHTGNKGWFREGHPPLGGAVKRPEKWATVLCPCGKEFETLIVKNTKTCSNVCRYKYRKPRPAHSEETKRKIGLANKKFYSANPHKIPTWSGGVSFNKYTWEFKNKTRNEVRARDSYTCQECSTTEEALGYTFSSHHIDYDTLNNSLNNLILLCRSCHAKTNVNRSYWHGYFTSKI